MRLLRSLVLVVAAAAAAACSSAPSLPETDADLAGTLTEFRLDQAQIQVLVERDLPEPQDRTIVRVGSDARVYLVEGRGGRLIPASRDDLAVGDRLQVWTTGVELRSYPAQVTATRIHIFR
jgi:hypothetical protein